MLLAGIIGLGDVAQSHHLPAYTQSPGVSLTAICDPVDEKRRRIATEYGYPAQFSDPHEMIDTSDLDLVSICTPPATHRKIVIHAAESGIALLCEKPTATTVEDAREMVRVTDRAGVVAAGGYSFQFSPTFARALRQIEHHVIGSVKRIEVVNYLSGGPSKGWERDSEQSGGGALINLLPHVLSYFLRFLDGETAVTDATAERYAAPNIESDVSLSMRIGETRIHVDTGFRSYGGPRRIHLFGADGELDLSFRYGTVDVNGTAFRYARSGLPTLLLQPLGRGLRDPPLLTRYAPYSGDGKGIGRVKSFVDAVKGDGPNRAPLSDSLKILPVIQEAYELLDIDAPITET